MDIDNKGGAVADIAEYNLTQAYIQGILSHPANDRDASMSEVENAAKFLHQVLWQAQLEDRNAMNMIVKAARHIGGKV